MEKSTIEKFEEGKKQIDLSGLWIIPYADFMTVLMIFFLLMFAFAFAHKDQHFEKIVTNIQQEMGGKVNQELIDKIVEQEREIMAADKLSETVEKQNLKKYMSVTSDNEYIKIVFNNPVLFDTGNADIKPQAQMMLHSVSQTLKDMPNEVIVEGHTDNVPILGGKYESNWELSVARALAVIRYLSHVEGISHKKFAAAGYGEYRPLFPNDTEEHKAQNRRIEIKIVRKQFGETLYKSEKVIE
ncbi:MAG: OmpA family protein [Elusimicrobiota bacterium]